VNTRRAISRFHASLFAPVDIASLVVFRIAFGAIMFWEVLRYFSYGWIGKYWIEPAFHFTYPGFHWVKPWPGFGMYVHMGALAFFALLIAAGVFYRLGTVLFFLGITYVFLLEHALYLNHLYFVCLVSCLMIFVPAHRSFSGDAVLWPGIRTSAVAAWPLWLLRTQLSVVYIFAGVAKLNSDWFRGEPLRSWLAHLRTTPVVGAVLEWPGAFGLISWAGLAFDLLIVPLLLWKRTRTVAFIAAVCFHLINAWFFQIGIFPWFSIAMTTLFLDPSWPRRVFARFGPYVIPEAPSGHTDHRQRQTVVLLAIYTAIQVLVPLRHCLYPGDVAWTEEGHEFSWRMKLRGKTGRATFVVVNSGTGEVWPALPSDYLEPWQSRKMATRPELIRQFAHHLAALEEKRCGVPVEVHVKSRVKLNRRPSATLIDPRVDLGKEPYSIGAAAWILRDP
jgi:vitamin K-dependent gamma-carboxylase